MRTHLLRRSSLLTIILALALCVPFGAQAQQAGRPAAQVAPQLTIPPGGRMRVIVNLRAGFQPEGQLGGTQQVQLQRATIDQAQNALLSRLQGQPLGLVKTYEYIPYIALEVDAAGLQALAAAPEVASVVEDVPLPPLLDVSNTVMGVPAAWAAGADGTGQTVAVLDTGVAKTHPFLSGKVVSEACYSTNTGGTYPSTSVCPDGVASSTASGSGVNCPTSTSGCDHGTHVAGIVAGENASFSGVAPGADLIAIQVFSQFSSPNCGSSPSPCALTWSSDQLSALERVYALRNTYNIAAVNMSLGGGQNFSSCDSGANAALKAAIDNLRSAGIATLIASGNNGFSDSISSPACISTAIAVGSTTSDNADDIFGDPVPQDEVSFFSNSASMVKLLAPGHYINSAKIPGTGYANFRGTSMATPQVAGAWALLKSAAPGASVSEVLNALTTSGVPITAVRSGYPDITKPRIQVDDALATLFPAPNSLAASAVSQTQIALSWSQTNAYETSFKVERSPNGSSGWTEIGTAPANATSYSDPTATCNTTYYYRVRAANSSFNSAFSNTANAKTSACAPAATLSTSSLDYGNQRVNITSAAQSVTITSSGGAALNLSGIAISGDFARSGGTCPTSFPAPLAAGASCTVDVTFTPSATGARTGAVTISSDASASPHVVNLSGTGTTPALTLSTSSLTYDDQPINSTSSAKSVTLTNSGVGSLVFSNITVSGDFVRSAGTCPTSFPAPLAAGASCTINVTFTPSAIGARTGAVTIDSDASASPHVISLSGVSTELSSVFLPLAIAQ